MTIFRCCRRRRGRRDIIYYGENVAVQRGVKGEPLESARATHRTAPMGRRRAAYKGIACRSRSRPYYNLYTYILYIYSVYTQNFRYMRYTHSSGNWGGGALESRIDHWEHYVPKCVCVSGVHS